MRWVFVVVLVFVVAAVLDLGLLAGAMLALAVAAVHVADQGGVTTLTSPDWIGWGTGSSRWGVR